MPAACHALGRALRSAVTLATAAVLVGACAGAGSSITPTAGSGAIVAGLSEFKIEMAASSANTGRLAFSVTNNGTVDHEFLVIRTDTAAGDLPTKNGVLDIEAMGGTMEPGMHMPGMSPDSEMQHPPGTVGELEDIKPGTTAQLTIDNMAAGHYAIVCDLPTHYELGMYADFTVE